jgi:ADP-ribose pyrophosphatase YjhB (NUDIX family)
MARRIDYHDDPQAPKANSLVPSVNVVVVNDDGEILLIRRSDNGNWAVPGGGIDLDESVTQAAVRKTREETGIECEITGIVGIYSDPGTSPSTPATAKYARSSPSSSPLPPPVASRRQATRSARSGGFRARTLPGMRWTARCGYAWSITWPDAPAHRTWTRSDPRLAASAVLLCGQALLA